MATLTNWVTEAALPLRVASARFELLNREIERWSPGVAGAPVKSMIGFAEKPVLLALVPVVTPLTPAAEKVLFETRKSLMLTDEPVLNEKLFVVT